MNVNLLIIVLGYLLIGIILGRFTFTRRLGSNPRFYRAEMSKAYNAAVTWGIWSLIAWVIVFPVWLITQPLTSREKLKKKEEELAARERVIEQWAKVLFQ